MYVVNNYMLAYYFDCGYMRRTILCKTQLSHMGDTSIRISEDLADELYKRKSRGESYEDVIWRLIRNESEQDSSE
jgi:hypothetical protein